MKKLYLIFFRKLVGCKVKVPSRAKRRNEPTGSRSASRGRPPCSHKTSSYSSFSCSKLSLRKREIKGRTMPVNAVYLSENADALLDVRSRWRTVLSAEKSHKIAAETHERYAMNFNPGLLDIPTGTPFTPQIVRNILTDRVLSPFRGLEVPSRSMSHSESENER